MKYFVVVFLFVTMLFLAAPLVAAQTPCTPLYGGGVKENGDPYCAEDLQANAAPTTGFQTPNDSMVQGAATKGGTPLKPAPQVTKQPNTGPEMLGIMALLPAAYAGWKLRKRA